MLPAVASHSSGKSEERRREVFIHEIHFLEQTLEVFLGTFRIFIRQKETLGGGKLVSHKAVCTVLHPTLVSRTEGRRVHCTGLH